MQNAIMAKVSEAQLNTNLPNFKSGDTIKVTWVISNENEKERLQSFQGIVITVKGSLVTKNVVVRKGVKGKGVERTFPLHSPLLKNIEVVSKGKVRRARPFYLRQLSAKALKNKIKTNK